MLMPEKCPWSSLRISDYAFGASRNDSISLATNRRDAPGAVSPVTRPIGVEVHGRKVLEVEAGPLAGAGQVVDGGCTRARKAAR
jgi:hypothetical protein